MSNLCEICGKEDLFSYVTQEEVCASCKLLYNIPNKNFAVARRTAIDTIKKIHAHVTKPLEKP